MPPGGRDEQPAPPRLRARPVLAEAIRSGRRYWRQILPVAVAVSLVTATADIVLTDVVDAADMPVAITVTLLSWTLSLLGAVFLSGFLSQLAGVARPPDERPSVRGVARDLAWGRLAGADVMVVLIVIVGLVALIIPGLVFLVLLSVVGPVIDLEDRKVLAALRRSAHLVRRYFWTTALLVVAPAILASLIEGVGPHPDSPAGIAGLLAFRVVAEAPVEAFLGLISVRLFIWLAQLDDHAAGSPGHGSGPGAVAEPPRQGRK